MRNKRAANASERPRAKGSDRHWRSRLVGQAVASDGGLALVFAEKGKCSDLWESQLEGWNVEESAVVNEWIAKGEARGLAQGEARKARSLVLALGAKKFGPAPANVEAALRAIDSGDRLTAIADRLFEATSWDDLLATP